MKLLSFSVPDFIFFMHPLYRATGEGGRKVNFHGQHEGRIRSLLRGFRLPGLHRTEHHPPSSSEH